MVEKASHKTLISVGFGTFIFLFLLIFKPFGISQLEEGVAGFLLGFGLITTGVLLASFFGLPWMFKDYFLSENWTVGKMVLFSVLHFVIIAVLNWLYAGYKSGETHAIGLPMFILITLSVGIFPTFFEVYLIEKFLARKHKHVAQKLSGKIVELKHATEPVKPVELSSENGKDGVVIQPNQLLCIKAEGNYASIYYTQNDSVKRNLVRNSLANLFKCVEHDDLIKHCHRSYVVNFGQVSHVSGNARSYTLHVDALDFTVPVSRSFPKSFIQDFPERR